MSNALSAQPCLTLSDPKDCSQPGPSVLGIFQARILESIAFSEPMSLVSPVLAGGFFTTEPPGKPNKITIKRCSSLFLGCVIMNRKKYHILFAFWGCLVACCWAINFTPFTALLQLQSFCLLFPVPPPYSTSKEICIKHPCNLVFFLTYDYFLSRMNLDGSKGQHILWLLIYRKPQYDQLFRSVIL